MKKTIYTLNVNGYSPEITAMTYPLIRYWADKIGAEFFIIKKRKFPSWPVVYEKMQIYELAREHKNDWNIYIDSDALVHPEVIDFTTLIPRDTVAHNGCDMASVRWKYDNYLLRDGRNIGSCNWMTIASDWCLDLWHPMEDMDLHAAIENIFPTIEEVNTVITKEHLIDDYVLSRNIARYGLKFKSLLQLLKDIGMHDANFFWHLYTITVEEKVRMMREVLDSWKLPGWMLNYGR